MDDQNQNQAPRGHGSSQEARRAPEAAPAQSGQLPIRRPTFGPKQPPASGMGSVIRRTAADGASANGNPASWKVSQLPSSVDNQEKGVSRSGYASANRDHPSSVDNVEMRGMPATRYSHPIDEDDDEIGIVSNVDNLEDFEDLPVTPSSPQVVFTQLKEPAPYRPQGRSGLDAEVVRLLREAKKQQLLDKARQLGRDPGEGSKEVIKGVTRSAKTQRQYLERGNQLLARYRRERGILQDDLLSLDTIEFADWVMSLKPTLKPTTWRPYRQSAKAVLETLPDADDAIEILDSDTVESGSEPERVAEAKPRKGKDDREMPRRTSARKAKSISKPDFDRIISYLRYHSSSKKAPILIDMLIAGIATGLRPSEWMAASFEISEDPQAPNGRYVWLYVLNSKTTNNRGNGAVRTIDMSSMREQTIDAVRRMVDRGREWLIQGVYQQTQSQCAQLMYGVCERLFPGRKFTYSLYTTRHQFMANAKSYHPAEAVSAMAGHGVDNTATENYGKKRSAWNLEDIEDKAAPVAEEVATVKRRHTFYEDRIKMREAAGLKPIR